MVLEGLILLVGGVVVLIQIDGYVHIEWLHEVVLTDLGMLR